MEREVNYTEAQVARMVEAYKASPNRETTKELAQEFGKSEKSVIAKLAKEGVYVKAPRLNKAGELAVRKESLVKAISQMVGFNVESLEKASKQDLIRVANALARANADEAVAE